jgi:hypothetical protein
MTAQGIKRIFIIASASAVALFFIFAYFEYSVGHGAINTYSSITQDKQWTKHCFPAFAFWYAINLLNVYNGLIQGIAAIAVFAFTVLLWRVADKQREISKAQEELMKKQAQIMDETLKETRESNKEQGKLTREQITIQQAANVRHYDAAANAVAALKQQVEWARDEFLSTHRPRVVARDVFIFGRDGGSQINFSLYNRGDMVANVVGLQIYCAFEQPEEIYFPPIAAIGPPYPIKVETGERVLWSGLAEFSIDKYTDDTNTNFWVDGQPNVTLQLRITIIYKDSMNRNRQTSFHRRYDFMLKTFCKIEGSEHEYED